MRVIFFEIGTDYFGGGGGGVGDMDLNRKKNRVRTSFLMLTSACVRISLIAFPIP